MLFAGKNRSIFMWILLFITLDIPGHIKIAPKFGYMQDFSIMWIFPVPSLALDSDFIK